MRFINVDSLSDWFEMKNFLDMSATNFISLSDYCTANDNFPNLRKLRNDLKKESQTVFILPLSEYLRVNPEQAAQETYLFLNLFKGETYSFIIYFLMYILKSFFLSMKITDRRQNECVLLATPNTADNYSITIIQKTFQFQFGGDQVDNFKSYLQYWENTPNAALTLYTENAIYLQDKKFFDDVKVIANAFDLLKYHYDLSSEFKRSFGREEDWQKLAELIAATGNFERAVCKKFKIDGFRLST